MKSLQHIMQCWILTLLSSFVLFDARVVQGFLLASPSRSLTCLQGSVGDKFNRDITERSYRKAQGQGSGEMAAGAILGTLVAGPFGLLFGAQIGANLGARMAVDRARKEEMGRLGITQDMLDAVEQYGVALRQAMEGLRATQESLETHQALARRLDRDDKELYEQARMALEDGEEEKARKFLLKRNDNKDKMKKILILCADEKKRIGIMEENVEAIEQRAMELEALLQRTVGAKSRQDAYGDLDFSVPSEDPLLKRFRDFGIDK